jgi:hypothetical protein
MPDPRRAQKDRGTLTVGCRGPLTSGFELARGVSPAFIGWLDWRILYRLINYSMV